MMTTGSGLSYAFFQNGKFTVCTYDRSPQQKSYLRFHNLTELYLTGLNYISKIKKFRLKNFF